MKINNEMYKSDDSKRVHIRRIDIKNVYNILHIWVKSL